MKHVNQLMFMSFLLIGCKGLFAMNATGVAPASVSVSASSSAAEVKVSKLEYEVKQLRGTVRHLEAECARLKRKLRTSHASATEQIAALRVRAQEAELALLRMDMDNKEYAVSDQPRTSLSSPSTTSVSTQTTGTNRLRSVSYRTPPVRDDADNSDDSDGRQACVIQ
jgi:predicted RNase H-like nuclease (RuvC/YqgF family)